MPPPLPTPRDIPPVSETLAPEVKAPMRRMREEIQRLLGLIGVDRLDMAVTWRQLLDQGFAVLSTSTAPGRGGVVPGSLVVPTSAIDPEPDLTPPPDATGVTVIAGFSFVNVTWDAPIYTQGHGHGQSNIYAVKRPIPDPDPLPVFGDAALVSNVFGQTTVAALPSEMNTRWHVWVKWQTVDGIESINPAGGVNGTIDDTGQDVTQLLESLSAAAVDTSKPYSRVAFRADMFYVAPDADFNQEATPTGTVVGQLWFKPSTAVTKTWDGAAWQAFNVPLPFVINTSPVVEDGVSIPAGVYMDSAYIRNLSAMVARFGNAVIDNAMIASLTAAKITAGSIAVGEYLQSTGFVTGTTGWQIRGDGTAEFSGVVVRGTIYATAGLIGGNTIDATGIQSPGYTVGSTGWRWDTSGLLRAFASAGARVLDMAATGSDPVLKIGSAFEVLASGSATFAGALAAATGTFSGTLTAFAINAVDTINIAGQAVTIPTTAYSNTTVSCTASVLTTVQTVSWTSTGAPVFVAVSVVIEWLSPINADCQFTIVTNTGTTIWSGYVQSTRLGQNVFSFSMSWTSPPAGAVSLDLKAFPSLGIDVFNRTMLALETKR